MPDLSKFAALEDAEFRIVPTCASCVFYEKGSRTDWGHCRAIRHDHAKHGKCKMTGVPSNGYCGTHTLAEGRLQRQVGTYRKFWGPDMELTS